MTNYIYAIVCPETENIMYVGKSKQPYIRYSQHLANKQTEIGKWMRESIKNNVVPTLKILETVSGNAGVIEMNYIKHYLSIGQAVHNQELKPKKWGIIKNLPKENSKNKPKNNCLLTSNTIEAIKKDRVLFIDIQIALEVTERTMYKYLETNSSCLTYISAISVIAKHLKCHPKNFITNPEKLSSLLWK